MAAPARNWKNAPTAHPPGPKASFVAQMAHRVATREGRARYKLRQQTVEPIFGIIKEALGFRRFSLRGLTKVGQEWTLVTLAYNLRRLHRLGATLVQRDQNYLDSSLRRSQRVLAA